MEIKIKNKPNKKVLELELRQEEEQVCLYSQKGDEEQIIMRIYPDCEAHFRSNKHLELKS